MNFKDFHFAGDPLARPQGRIRGPPSPLRKPAAYCAPLKNGAQYTLPTLSFRLSIIWAT